jgi:hypothetical protein
MVLARSALTSEAEIREDFVTDGDEYPKVSASLHADKRAKRGSGSQEIVMNDHDVLNLPLLIFFIRKTIPNRAMRTEMRTSMSHAL